MNARPESPLDEDKLIALETLFAGDFRDYLGRFLENATRYAAEIGAGIQDGNLAIVRENAHKLKSSGAMFGLPRIAACCIELERCASAGAGSLADLHAELDGGLRAAQADFQPLLAAPDLTVSQWLTRRKAR